MCHVRKLNLSVACRQFLPTGYLRYLTFPANKAGVCFKGHGPPPYSPDTTVNSIKDKRDSERQTEGHKGIERERNKEKQRERERET